MTKIAIFISGRGSNMEAVIREVNSGILKGIAEIVLVFSNNPDAAGLKTAADSGIRIACINSKGKKRKLFDNEVINMLEYIEFDYIILAGYMRILSENFVNTYPKRIINIHPADTIHHQGLHAYEWAFNNNLNETKITIHYVDAGVDSGEIIAQTAVDLNHVKSLKEVELRGLSVEHKFYSETLRKLFEKNN